MERRVWGEEGRRGHQISLVVYLCAMTRERENCFRLFASNEACACVRWNPALWNHKTENAKPCSYPQIHICKLACTLHKPICHFLKKKKCHSSNVCFSSLQAGKFEVTVSLRWNCEKQIIRFYMRWKRKEWKAVISNILSNMRAESTPGRIT